MSDSEKPEGDLSEADGVTDGEEPKAEMERVELSDGEESEEQD